MADLRPFACLLLTTCAAGCLDPYTAPVRHDVVARPIADLPRAAPAGAQLLWVVSPGTRAMTSRWFLQLAGDALTLTLTGDGSAFTGTIVNGDGWADRVDNVRWDAESGVLEFRRIGAGFWQWFHARAVEGVLVGRASSSTVDGTAPGDVSLLSFHVTGWNEYYFGRDIVPRAYDIVTNGKHARLHLDRGAGGALTGRFKVYASDGNGDLDEEPEYDVDVQQWDGKTLRFVRAGDTWTQTYEGTAVDGRSLTGVMHADDGSRYLFAGTRTELTSFGLAPRDPSARADWQARTRRQLTHIMMGDNPAPDTVDVTRQPASLSPGGNATSPDRDDDQAQYPPNFAVDELTMQLTVPSMYGGPPMTRSIHGFITTPGGAAPPRGWPAIVVLNGHDGSAASTLDPNDPMYWYGDAWARRGFVVLAIDVGHRPLEDRPGVYTDYDVGDSPAKGNNLHPALKAPGLDSDWAEDGERVWDVARGIDWLSTLGSVDMSRVAVTGLSMGAEVATLTGALDTRVAAVIPSGYAPDFTVIGWHGNHPCYLWNNGSPLDFFDVADLHALVAPRPLIVEIGHGDNSFSDFSPPFADAKELTRRSRVAYADASDHFVVYLHPGPHEYRFGGGLTDGTVGIGLTTPAVTGPRAPGDVTWAADDATNAVGVALADQLRAFIPATAN